MQQTPSNTDTSRDIKSPRANSNLLGQSIEVKTYRLIFIELKTCRGSCVTRKQ